MYLLKTNTSTLPTPPPPVALQVVVMLATVTVFFFVSLFPFRVLTLWIVWTPIADIKSLGALRFYR